MSQNRAFLGLAVLAVGVAALSAVGLTYYALAPAKGPPAVTAIVELRRNEPPPEISRLLEARGVIGNSRMFMGLGRITRRWKKVKAGEYQVSSAMSPMEIFGVITSGISVPHPVTVREGENMYEIAADFEAKGLAPRDQILSLCKDKVFSESLVQAPTLEGYLFPETYFFNRTMSGPEMLQAMVHKFQAEWKPEFDEQAASLKMDKRDIVILASIIEKETGAPDERPIISSVFYNRLHKKMKLQSDPTTIYGIWERYDGNIHRSDLTQSTPYNTYVVPALPAGPISNPGREAIHAALFPASSPYFYFVSHNDGTHQFSKTFEEHNKAVRKFQLDPAARAGKSWRDLKKRDKAGR